MVKESTSLKLEKEVLERVKIEAKKDNRPVSNYIETVLIQHFEEIDKEQSTKNPGK